jgi:biopolymer transport protein ExbD
MNLRPRRRDDMTPEINLVSLIDVVLILVVFFLLSSQFVVEGRLRIELPQASTPASARRTAAPLVVTVLQSGEYRVNDRELINSSPDTLRTALEREAGADHGRPVVIRADARATHQSVVTVMDVAGSLGFAELDIATVNNGPAPAPVPTPAAEAAPAPTAAPDSSPAANPAASPP